MRKIEKITSPVKAIRAKCIDCCGGEKNEVKLCPCEDCPIYPFRFGKNPFHTRKAMTDEEREEVGRRLNAARAAKTNEYIRYYTI